MTHHDKRQKKKREKGSDNTNQTTDRNYEHSISQTLWKNILFIWLLFYIFIVVKKDRKSLYQRDDGKKG